MKSLTATFLLAVLFAIHMQVLVRAGDERKSLPTEAGNGMVLPSPILKITALEFKGLVSDLLFLKALVFEGSTYQRNEEPRLKPKEWQWLDKVLTASTDLDPYFVDPYYFANAHMTWEGGMVRETNRMLEKGTRYRDWDWMLPFFEGFNYFYFLHDSTKAAELLKTAAQRPGPSEQLLSLASRLTFKERKTENSILFLEAVLKKTENENLRKEYETRVSALHARLLLERAVSAYKKKFTRPPLSLQRMIESGVLRKIPEDPYGGSFSLGPEGEIHCTSDYKLLPKPK
jgi:hypothetical protein